MMRSSNLPARLARTGCSVLALATVFVVGASPAAAQSFVGTGSITTNTGGVSGITTGPNLTTISVNPGQTVIDWSPTDTAMGGGTINFQPAGTTANFLGTGNYAVLNRINPADSTRSITMNGTIQALTLGAAAASNGSIYFYTPGGFVIGGSAVINVGSFVLSASPITVDGSGLFINGADNSVIFGQASQPGAAIVTTAGSQINASAGDAYVAMVAPRVQHGGTINVNGSAALVGAEAATINFSPDGLFDIQVTTGTTNANGVVSNGTITGAQSAGAGDIHRVYMVAVPKNAALTMAITQGGSLGFNIAGAANVDGNTVVLSAGYNISDGSIENAPAAAGNGFDASFSVTGATMTSALVAAASGNAIISSPVGQSSNFASNVTMHGVDSARVQAFGATTTINIAGNLDLSTATTGNVTTPNAVSGLVEIAALQNASVTVTGTTTLNSNAYGAGSLTANVAGGNAIAGDIYVTGQVGGDVNLNGGLSATANGYGGYAAALNATGGSGTGGNIVFSASGTGSNINVTGNMTLAANGFGGSGSGLECFSCDGDGGVGNGGTVDVFAAAGGDLNLGAGGVSISTNGVGGYSGRDNGGNAFGGGLTRIYADGVGSSVTSSGVTNVSSNATGGNANNGTGGAVEGGDIDIFAQNGGNVLIDNALTASANGTGGAGAFGGGGAFGGSVSIFSTASLQIDGTLNATADATGGLQYYTNTGGNSAGDAFGGFVDVWAQNGQLTIVGAATLSTNARGGEVSHPEDQAGDGIGGTTRLFANAGGTLDLQSTLDITAIGTGGGSAYYGGGFGGNGLGGAVRVQATAALASITIADEATLDASGYGSESRGGNGTGGTAWSDSFGAATSSLTYLSDVYLYAQGVGGDSNNGNGGNGQGGSALLQAGAGSTLSVGGNATLDTNAFGGYSYDFSDGVGGNAAGGQSRIQTYGGGNIDIDGSGFVFADGLGGDTYSFIDGAAGNGTGGSAHIITTGGTITIGTDTGNGVDVSADGFGGNADAGLGGNGSGGTFARIEAIDGDITIGGYASASASGTGGDGYIGGTGIGSGDTSNANSALWTGGAHIFARNGDIVITGGASVAATGTGGNGGDNNGYGGDFGGDGGDGIGGWASIHAANSNLGPSLITIVSGTTEGSGFATVTTDGTGGNGGDGNDGNDGNWGNDGSSGLDGTNGDNGSFGNAGGTGGRGGNGVGGVSVITASADNGRVDITFASASANALGGTGGIGGNGGNGGNGGDGGDGLEGFGGDGGDGGTGGEGGLGGDGGSATAGRATIGTESGNGSALGLGLGRGDYGSMMIDASAIGGLGGDGGSAGTGGAGGTAGLGIPNGTDGSAGATGFDGSGGNGGNARGGAATLLVRGSIVDVGSVTLHADATGGAGGGGGGGGGAGGNATVGGSGSGMGILASSRFQVATQRGTLNAGNVTGTAIAAGGLGSTDGIGESLGENGLFFSNADGNIGSLDFVVQADGLGTGALADLISVTNGDVIVDGAVSFVTSGTMSLFLDTGDFTADTIKWYAADFVPAPGLPVDNGTFFANSFDISTGNNFITTANLDSVQTLTIVAPGAIQIANVTGDADIILDAKGAEVDIGNVLAGGGIDIDAAGFIFTGNLNGSGVIDLDAGAWIQTGSIFNNGNTSLNAGTSINVGSINSGAGNVTLVTNSSYIAGDTVAAGSIYADSGSDLFLGNLTTTGDIELVAVTDIFVGNAIAGETIDMDAGGYIDGGNMTAGNSVYAGAGESINLLDISAGLVNQSGDEGAEFNVGLLAGTTIDTGDIDALNSIGLGAGGNIFTGTIDAGNIFLALSGGNMSFGEINADGTTYLADDSMIPIGGDPSEFDPAPILALSPVPSGGSITLRGAVTTGKFVAAASGAISGSTIDSDTSIYTANGGNVTLTNLDAGTSIFQRSGGIITENNLTAGTFIDIRSAGGLALGNLVAGDYIDLRSNGAIGLGNATSGETINFLSGSTVTGLAMTAGNSVLVESTGAIQLGNVTAGITDQSTAIGADYAARFSSSGTLTTGNVNALGRIGFGTPTNLVTGTLTSGAGLMALVGGNMTSGAINASEYVYLANHSMAALGGTFPAFNRAPILALAPVATGGSINIGAVATGQFDAAAGTTLTGTTINSGNQINASSGGNMTLGNLRANDDIRLTSGGNMVIGTIDSDDDIGLVATGSISTLDIFAYDDITGDAGTTITTDDITGNSINLFAGGDITTGDLLTQNFFTNEAAPPLVPGSSISIVSANDIDVGNIDALDGVDLSSEGGIATGTILADTFVQLYADGNMTTGNITAGTDLFAESGGTMSLGALTAADIELDSTGNMSFISANSGSEFDFSTDGSVNGGNVTAGSQISGDALGSVTLANLTVAGPPEAGEVASIGIAAFGNISVGNVSGFSAVGFATESDLTTGNILAGGLFLTMVGGNTTTGSITTSGPGNGRVYMADDSMFIAGGGVIDGEGNGEFDPSVVLALAPVPTGGNITINGPVITGQFQAAAGNNLATRAITATSINAYAGGTAAIDGIWAAGSTFLASNDINITANGRIDGGTNGPITLNSINSNGALIGDGLTGSGYALSNAEFGRVSGGNITIVAGGYAGAAATMKIGDLTITGPLAGSNVESSGGGVEFVTRNTAGNALSGTMRVSGDVVATGFGANNYLGFYTQNFELDAGTGLISITGNAGALAGTLELYASRIHVAEATLLDQLAVNPQFAGYRTALNNQAAVQRPDGVIRAANFDIEFGGGTNVGPYTLYVQNMGTTTVPAGFLLNAANISDDGESSLPAGSVDMAINGQIITEGGTLTGLAVRDLLVTEFGTEAFAAGSTINGCGLVGPCGSPPPPQIDTPVRTDVQLTDNSGLGDGLFGNEGDIDDGEDGDDGDRSSPISPPNPLFDSRPLGQSGDVDDPISGAGNPSLIESQDDVADADCDAAKDKSCKTGTKGDGK